VPPSQATRAPFGLPGPHDDAGATRGRRHAAKPRSRPPAARTLRRVDVRFAPLVAGGPLWAGSAVTTRRLPESRASRSSASAAVCGRYSRRWTRLLADRLRAAPTNGAALPRRGQAEEWQRPAAEKRG